MKFGTRINLLAKSLFQLRTVNTGLYKYSLNPFSGRAGVAGVLQARLSVAGRHLAAVVGEGAGVGGGRAGREGGRPQREPLRPLHRTEVRPLHLQEGQGRLGKGESMSNRTSIQVGVVSIPPPT